MIKKVNINEIDRVMEIINDGIKLLSTYSTQWQQGYPNKDQLLNDLKLERLFGYYEDDMLLGVMALVPGFNPDYEYIEGAWDYISGDSDITIHRIATKKEAYGKHIGQKLFKFAIEYAKENGYKSIKADTYPINGPLNHLCISNGFSLKGTIYIVRPEINRERNAYELLIK